MSQRRRGLLSEPVERSNGNLLGILLATLSAQSCSTYSSNSGRLSTHSETGWGCLRGQADSGAEGEIESGAARATSRGNSEPHTGARYQPRTYLQTMAAPPAPSKGVLGDVSFLLGRLTGSALASVRADGPTIGSLRLSTQSSLPEPTRA